VKKAEEKKVNTEQKGAKRPGFDWVFGGSKKRKGIEVARRKGVKGANQKQTKTDQKPGKTKKNQVSTKKQRKSR